MKDMNLIVRLNQHTIRNLSMVCELRNMDYNALIEQILTDYFVQYQNKDGEIAPVKGLVFPSDMEMIALQNKKGTEPLNEKDIQSSCRKCYILGEYILFGLPYVRVFNKDGYFENVDKDRVTVFDWADDEENES